APARWDQLLAKARRDLREGEVLFSQGVDEAFAASGDSLMNAQLSFAREMIRLAAYAPDAERERSATDWFDLMTTLFLCLGPSADDEVVYHLGAFAALSDLGPKDRQVSAPIPIT